MPLLARHSANKNLAELKNTFVSAQVMVFCLTIPAAVGLFLLAEPIIKLIFERGVFTSADTVATAQALSLYAIGLFAYSSNKVLVPVFYAIEKPHYPVIASFLAICTNYLFVTMTIDMYQHRAIALSVSITMMVNFIFLTAILYQKLNGFAVKQMFISTIKIGAASSIMALFLLIATRLGSDLLMTSNVWQLCAVVFSIIAFAVTIYSLSLYFLKLSEFIEITTKIKRKLYKQG